jgi:hypothetical protein
LFTSGDNNNNSNNNNNNNDNNSSRSDLAERIMALNESNYFGRDERTGEPIILLKDSEDQNALPPKIKNLSHGKLVGDSIVSVGKIIPDRLSSSDNSKRLSDVGIICNTNNEECEKIKEEILVEQDEFNNTQSPATSSGSSTINRTRSTRSTATNVSTVDDNSIENNNYLKKKISSMSLNQQNNLETIAEKLSNVDDDVDKPDKEKTSPK